MIKWKKILQIGTGILPAIDIAIAQTPLAAKAYQFSLLNQQPAQSMNPAIIILAIIIFVILMRNRSRRKNVK